MTTPDRHSLPAKDNSQRPRVTSVDPSHTISGSERNQAFRTTMGQAQSHMNLPQRLLSRTLHSRAVSILSDSIGGTLARPIALLSGVLIAIVATASMYIAAKYYGYTLSGSEPIVAFGAGWVIGGIIEYTQVLLRGGRLKNRRS